jgi:hypothetical protein
LTHTWNVWKNDVASNDKPEYIVSNGSAFQAPLMSWWEKEEAYKNIGGTNDFVF